MTERRLTPLRAIRLNCLDCCAQQRAEVRRCHIEDCSLHPYRMGHNPRREGVGGRPPEGQKPARESAKPERGA